MAIREITNVDKPDRYSTTEAIQRVAGPGWGPLTLAQAVAWAELPGNYFIVRSPYGTAIDVVVMPPKTIYGNKYLRTKADNTITDNLLSLPPIVSTSYGYR